MKTLVIGYGNPLRGDDALGFYAVKELSGIIKNENVKFIFVHQLDIELAYDISLCERVIFIDSLNEQPSGRIKHFIVSPEIFESELTTHQMSPQSLLQICKSIYDVAPKAEIFTITGEYFGLDENMSNEMDIVFPRLLEEIKQNLLHP